MANFKSEIWGNILNIVSFFFMSADVFTYIMMYSGYKCRHSTWRFFLDCLHTR